MKSKDFAKKCPACEKNCGRPSLLDLFCGAGGCARGYQMAGFCVLGIDLATQKHYAGCRFIQGDALSFLREHGHEFDFIHASPPCQGYSTLAAMHPGKVWPKLIDQVRSLVKATGKPYVIENVETAPLRRESDLFGNHGVMLCGSMFGLGVARGFLRRHRIFETSFPLPQPACKHVGKAVGVYGHGGYTGKHRKLYREEASKAMGIDWMNRDEMCQAIPPAYTEWIARQWCTANAEGQPRREGLCRVRPAQRGGPEAGMEEAQGKCDA